MTFLFPAGLFALLALPTILVLHLIRRQRRQVRIPSLELWRQTPTPVQQKRRRLPLTLLLLLHLLVAALLAVALGRPLLPGNMFEPTNTIVVIDTSTSMAATDVTGAPGRTRFQAAQAAAQRILSSAREGDQIGLVTLGPVPRLEGRGGPEASGTLIDAISRLKPAGADGDLAAALSLASATEPDPGQPMRTRIVVLTDPSFRSEAQPNQPLQVAGELEWRTLGSPGDNVAVVALAARPLRTGGQQLYARVANFGTRPAARQFEILLDGATIQTEPVRLNGGMEAEWSWTLPRGAEVVEGRLSPGDLAPADDHASTIMAGGQRLRVQLASRVPTALERALRAQPGLEVMVTTAADYRHDPTADIAVLVDFIPEPLPPVPTLIVAPPRDNPLIPVGEYERDLRVDSVLDSRFAGIDLRSVLFTRVARVERPAWASAALLSGDTPLVLTGILQDQMRSVWTFDPAATSLPGRLAFPLLTAATIRTLVPSSGTSLMVGQAAPEAMIAPDGSTLPAGTILDQPGVYRWEGQDGAMAVNAIDPFESNLQARPRPETAELPPGPRTVMRDADRHLWRWLIIATLALVVLEWLYSHRHELPWRRRRPGGGHRARTEPPLGRPA